MKNLKLLLILLVISVTNTLIAQDVEIKDVIFRIDEIKANQNKKVVQLYLTGLKNGKSLFQGGVDEFQVFQSGSNLPSDLEMVIDSNYEKSGEQALETQVVASDTKPLTILFLMDLSGSMKVDKLNQAKKAVRYSLENMPSNANVYFSTFQNVISENTPLTVNNFNQVVEPLETQPNYHTDLYRAVHEKVTGLSTVEGDKVLILLTDGRDEAELVPTYYEEDIERVSQNQVLETISGIDKEFRIFAVGIGNDANKKFLEQIALQTPNEGDGYKFGVAPEDLGSTIQEQIITQLASNYILSVYFPKENDKYNTYGKSEGRNFIVRYTHNGETLETNKEATLAGFSKEIDFGIQYKSEEVSNPYWIGLWGFLLLLLLLALFSAFVPMRNQYIFKNKFIKKYKEIKEPGVIIRDQYSRKEITNDDEELVIHNGKILTLKNWKWIKVNMKDNYGEFAEMFALENSGNFFSGKGYFKRLNWIWFGGIGGFLAWLIVQGLYTLNLESVPSIQESLQFLDTDKEISDSVLGDTLLGVAMGTGIIVALSIIEELGQSRAVNFGRILLRTLIGLVISMIVFFSISALTLKFISHPYLASLISWMILGITLGWVVSIQSSIEAINGIKAGLLAGFVAYNAMELFGILMTNVSPDLIAVLSYIIYGLVLGGTIFAVITRLESFELQFTSPSKHSGKVVGISKWLKYAPFITLGTDRSSEVLIKWDQEDPEAQPKHAKFTFKDNAVKIEALASLYINNKKLDPGKKITLQNDDEIKLGANGITKMKFIAKVQTIKPGEEENKPDTSVKLNKFIDESELDDIEIIDIRDISSSKKNK
ncbi:MAG: VWA domain-containing protein [Saprospiraceae bacterium]